ncbi:MAG: ATP-binding cassette domain-containing protein, partial [Gammaproteobacteria bacterium]|nr:ATP-binding cassette domain-containing protein [Gammaproteobacteria bacterium]
MRDTALRAESISKRFGERRAVREASFDVRGGEVVGLLGPNGAGKTTAFYVVAGLLSCDTGCVRLDGVDVTGFPVHRRALLGLGYLPQEASVFRKLSVEQNILAILELR